MSLGDMTLLQSATTQKNYALRVVAMMQAQLIFLQPFLDFDSRKILQAQLCLIESEIRNFNIKEHLKELKEVLPHRN